MDYIAQLSRAIETIKQQKPNSNRAIRGTIVGDMVDINGTKYPYDAVTDVITAEGFPVWCQMTEDGKRAVVIGA